MTETFMQKMGIDRVETGDDHVVPFTLDTLDTRGRTVQLADSIDNILVQHNYPEPVSRVLGEAIVLASLVGTSLKFAGKLILQTETGGPISRVIVDFQAPDGIRACARFSRQKLEALSEQESLDTGALLGEGYLAMTIDQGSHTERYQGIVALDGVNLEEVAHRYFAQSEQIPTRVRLAVAKMAKQGEHGEEHWRAAGMLIQFLPESLADVHKAEGLVPDIPGDGLEDEDSREPQNWVHARALFQTIEDHELVDPNISPERLLYRLFHEDGARVYDPTPITDRCTCSHDKVKAMLGGFSQEERDDMAKQGVIEVDCEFCSKTYVFEPDNF